MLPVTIEMRDHLRQEKTGNLPSPLPEVQRQTEFSAGTLGLWGTMTSSSITGTDACPGPGIIVLGRVEATCRSSIAPDPVTVRIEPAD